MKEIIALQQYTNKYISLYEGQIRNINEELAQQLIQKGIVAEHDESGGGSGGGAIPLSGDGVFTLRFTINYYGNTGQYSSGELTDQDFTNEDFKNYVFANYDKVSPMFIVYIKTKHYKSPEDLTPTGQPDDEFRYIFTNMIFGILPYGDHMYSYSGSVYRGGKYFMLDACTFGDDPFSLYSDNG